MSGPHLPGDNPQNEQVQAGDPGQPCKPRWVRRLSDEDAAILDALLAAPDRDAAADQLARQHHPDRVARLKSLLVLLDAAPTDTAADDPQRVRRTCDAVKSAQFREKLTQQSQMGGAPMSRFGLRQAAMIAVMFVVGGSLLLPVLERNRATAQRIACAANLRLAGEAMGQYAQDHRHMLPRGNAKPGATWWNVGRSSDNDSDVVQSNSAHLYKLVRGQYIDASTLACPTNPHAPAKGEMTAKQRDWTRPEHVSYSYQNQYTEQPWHVDKHSNLAVLADRNPLFVARSGRIVFDQSTPTDAPSRGHARRGQNVLSLNGNVDWTVRPFRAGLDRNQPDNIWTAAGIDRYTGTEQPHHADDSFLVP